MKHVILLDICGTIFRSNTTFDFLDYTFRFNHSYRRYRRFSKLFVCRVVTGLIYRLFKNDIKRKFFLRFLKGYTSEELQQMVHNFYQSFLLERINEPIVNRVKETSHNVVIVSATIEPIAKTVANKLGIKHYYSTELEYDEYGKCTGNIKNDLLGRKLSTLLNNEILPTYALTISDDITDLPLFKKSESSIIVTPNKRLIKWKQLIKKNNISNVQFICID